MIDLERFPQDETALKMLATVSPIYDRAYVTKWLFEVFGREWSEARRFCEELRQQTFPETATWGIGYWEQQYHLETNDALPLEERRRRVLVQRSIRSPMNPEKVGNLVTELTGMACSVTDPVKSYVFNVSIAVPEGAGTQMLRGVFALLERVKPAHLSYQITAGVEAAAVRNRSALHFLTLVLGVRVYNFGDNRVIFNGRYRFNGLLEFRPERSKGMTANQLVLDLQSPNAPGRAVVCTAFGVSAANRGAARLGAVKYMARLREPGRGRLSGAAFSVRAQSGERAKMALEQDSLYPFDGSYRFDGARRFNARLIKEEL